MRLLLILLLFSSCKSTECQDEKACMLFKEQLALVEKGINKEPIDVGKINNAIVFLEKITSINSTSDGNYIGRFKPSKKDYENWNNWYLNNKHLLLLDKKSKKVKVKK